MPNHWNRDRLPAEPSPPKRRTTHPFASSTMQSRSDPDPAYTICAVCDQERRAPVHELEETPAEVIEVEQRRLGESD